MTRPQPLVEHVIAWCGRCVSSSSDLTERDAHAWAERHATQTGHRTHVRVRTVTSYPESEDR